MPLEAVWGDSRVDLTRKRPQGEVGTGYTRFRDGDVLVPKVTPTFQAGRATIAKELVRGVGAGSTELHVLRPKLNVDVRFLRYVVLSKPFLTEGVSAFQGVAGLQRIPDDFLRNFPVVRVSLSEQRRIADFLDGETVQIDQLVSVQRRVLNVLRARREVAVFSQVTGLCDRGMRRLSNIGWIDSLPKDWQEVRLGLLARMGSGHTPSRSNSEWWEDCSIPWVTTGEVSQVRDDRRETLLDTREKISELGLKNSSAELHPEGTVVLCRTASAGYSAVMGKPMATSQDFATWTCGNRLEPYYLLWCLRAMRNYLLGRLAMGSTHKTIYVPDLQMLRIPVPELKEQREIVSRIRESNAQTDRLVDAVSSQVELLAERRQALITAAVTGQLDVTTARGADA
jgi:type I restriction enzyme, S subunit